jgi:MFS superfamily sulfate permease-like transporter
VLVVVSVALTQTLYHLPKCILSAIIYQVGREGW